MNVDKVCDRKILVQKPKGNEQDNLATHNNKCMSLKKTLLNLNGETKGHKTFLKYLSCPLLGTYQLLKIRFIKDMA